MDWVGRDHAERGFVWGDCLKKQGMSSLTVGVVVRSTILAGYSPCKQADNEKEPNLPLHTLTDRIFNIAQLPKSRANEDAEGNFEVV